MACCWPCLTWGLQDTALIRTRSILVQGWNCSGHVPKHTRLRWPLRARRVGICPRRLHAWLLRKLGPGPPRPLFLPQGGRRPVGPIAQAPRKGPLRPWLRAPQNLSLVLCPQIVAVLRTCHSQLRNEHDKIYFINF